MDSWHVSSKADAKTSYDLFRDMVTCSKDFLRSISSPVALRGRSSLDLESAFPECERFHFPNASEFGAPAC